MLRAAFWLLVLLMLAWSSWRIGQGPDDPRTKRRPAGKPSLSASASQPPAPMPSSTPETASVQRTARKLFVYSPHGWRSTCEDWEEDLLDGVPGGWLAFVGAPEKVARTARLLRVLSRAEDRAVNQPWQAAEMPALGGADTSLPDNHEVWVYPVADIEDLLGIQHDARLLAWNWLSPYQTIVTPLRRQSLHSSGAILVSGTASEHAGLRLLFDSIRRERDGLPRADAVASIRWPQRVLLFHAGWQLGGSEHVAEILTLLNLVTLQHRPDKVHAVPGGFLLLGSGEEHAWLAWRLRERRVVESAQLLHGSPSRRRQACLAAVTDDDPLIQELAFRELTDDSSLPLGSRAAAVLEAWVTRGNRQTWRPMVPRALWDQLSPADAAQAITRLARSEPEAGRLCWLLRDGLVHPEAEVRQAAHRACAARLAWETIWLFRQCLFHSPDAVQHWLPEEREQFIAGMEASLREELAAGGSPMKTVQAMGEALTLAEGDFLPKPSPAWSRLCELSAWVALNQNLEPLADRWLRRDLALVESVHHENPETRRQALLLLKDLVSAEGSLPDEARRVVRELEGDPYTEDLIPHVAPGR